MPMRHVYRVNLTLMALSTVVVAGGILVLTVPLMVSADSEFPYAEPRDTIGVYRPPIVPLADTGGNQYLSCVDTAMHYYHVTADAYLDVGADEDSPAAAHTYVMHTAQAQLQYDLAVCQIYLATSGTDAAP